MLKKYMSKTWIFIFSTHSYKDPRVPTQVLQSLIKSYICFSICKALQSLIFGVISYQRSYKVLFLKEKKVLELEIWFLPWS